MDETKTYIKMCDCPKIQGQWKPKDGDVFFDEELYKNAKKLKNKINFDLSHKALGIVAKGNFVCDHCNEESDLYPFDKFYPQEDVIWLPRQDDIQKMFKEEAFVLAGEFSHTMESFITGDPSWWTMKGLWLAYYMWKKHGKIWGGRNGSKKNLNN